VNETSLKEQDGRLKAAGGNDGAHLLHGQKSDVSAIGRAELLQLLVGHVPGFHQPQPNLEYALIRGGSDIGGQIRTGQVSARSKPLGNGTEEVGSGIRCQNELGNEQRRGGVERLRRRSESR